MNVQTLPIEMHAKLAMDIIKRQAGTFDKAILELVMNAVEAGATKVDLSIVKTDDGLIFFRCSDDGRGIQTIEEVKNHFATLGTPHSESEKKIWAQFRMGRGQAWSFGKNSWRTSTFNLTVDVDNKGLNYDLIQNMTPIQGCNILIELYHSEHFIPHQYPSMDALVDQVKKQVEFIKVPVYFNGVILNHDPDTLNWDFEDQYAYYLFGVGDSLKIYNLGVYVKSLDASLSGVTGVIVSKQQLKVNFARNDIQYDCPIYKQIGEVIIQNRVQKTRQSRRRLVQHERHAVLRDIRNGVANWEDYKNIGLIPDSSGKMHTFQEILSMKKSWCFAPDNDNVADKLNQLGNHVCFSRTLLDILNCRDRDESYFFGWITSSYKFDRVRILYRDFEEIRHVFKDTKSIIPESELTVLEKRCLRVLNWTNERLDFLNGRKLFFGVSDTASAWTDGQSYIALSRSYWSDQRYKLNGSDKRHTTELLVTLIHEMSHDDSSETSHIHGEEFYRAFHDSMIRGNGLTLLSYVDVISRRLQQEKKSEQVNAIINKKEKANKRIKSKLGIAV